MNWAPVPRLHQIQIQHHSKTKPQNFLPTTALNISWKRGDFFFSLPPDITKVLHEVTLTDDFQKFLTLHPNMVNTMN